MDNLEPINTSKKPFVKVILVVTFIIAIIAVGLIYLIRLETTPVDEILNTENSTTTVNVGGVTFELPPGTSAVISPVPTVDSSKLPPVPNLDRAVSYPNFFPDEAIKIFAPRFTEAKLKAINNPTDYDVWITVGIYFKQVEDFEGARLSWEYATKIQPENYLAYGNLGFLYGYHLKDLKKAIYNYETAMKYAGDQANVYVQAFEFYRDVVKDFAEARKVAERGILATGQKELFTKLVEVLKQ
jgi:hypothetical protein